MILSNKELKQMARNFVINSMRIGTKPNPRVEKAKKQFGNNFIKKILTKKVFSKNYFNEKELKIIEKLKDPEYGPLIVEWKNKYYVKKTVGHTVRLLYSVCSTG